jgi:hypothetical protein
MRKGRILRLSEFVERYVLPVPVVREVAAMLQLFAAIAFVPFYLLYRTLKATFRGARQRIKDEFSKD